MTTPHPTALTKSVILACCFLNGGCEKPADSPPSEGSQAAAETYFKQDMQNWMSGQESAAKKLDIRNVTLAPPIGYDVRSVLPVEADPFASTSPGKLPQDYRSFPAYQFNTVLQWMSEANRPMETVNRFKLTWNTHEKKWFYSKVF